MVSRGLGIIHKESARRTHILYAQTAELRTKHSKIKLPGVESCPPFVQHLHSGNTHAASRTRRVAPVPFGLDDKCFERARLGGRYMTDARTLISAIR